jgi:hypothetical protein
VTPPQVKKKAQKFSKQGIYFGSDQKAYPVKIGYAQLEEVLTSTPKRTPNQTITEY